MLKQGLYLFLLLSLVPLICHAEPINKNTPSNEISTLDLLIKSTEQSVENQKYLRQLIVKYQDSLKLYLKDPDNSDRMLSTAKEAYRALECIKENYLESTFDPKFIEELTVFAKVANKRGIPKP